MSIVMPTLLGVLGSLGASVAVASWMLRGRAATIALDHPNERSLHRNPVPRTGGVAIVVGTIAGVLVSGQWDPMVFIGLVLAAVSFGEDVRGLSVKWRLAAHLAAALAAVRFVHSAPPILWPVLILWIAWMTNLYNFMDGSDGLAGGMAVFGFGALGIAAIGSGQSGIASASLSVAAAAIGFLAYNFPPARIFMGDVGSIFLGFLAGALSVEGWRAGVWAWWFPLAVFAPFVVDATTTLLRRAIQGETVWKPHREHFYQRLILSGWTHRRAAVVEYVVMGICAASALLARGAPPRVAAALLGGLLSLLGSCLIAAELRWRRFLRRTASSLETSEFALNRRDDSG